MDEEITRRIRRVTATCNITWKLLTKWRAQCTPGGELCLHNDTTRGQTGSRVFRKLAIYRIKCCRDEIIT